MPAHQDRPSPANWPSPAIWDADGHLRSSRNGDVYFSRDDGLAESRAVFLAGCGLPGAWAARERFTVGELGFGTGLNVAALLELWGRARPPDAQLHIFSIEADPLPRGDAERTLSLWPALGPIAARLIAGWPGRARGFHRLDLPDLNATLDVAIMEAAEALESWAGAADAWFLDGFAPGLSAGEPQNPWRPAVLDLVARRSAPGARAASYTVAGSVRRSLASSGFEVTRQAGHGRKRQRLEGRLEAPPASPVPPGPPPPRRIAIIGAGIAGAALARAFADLGVRARVFDAMGVGAGASGVPAALVAPRLDAGLGDAAALFAQAARRAVALYDTTPDAVIGRNALQLVAGPKDPGRFAAIAASDLFEPDAMRRLNPGEASAWAGETTPDGLLVAEARVIDPKAVLAPWLGPSERARVARVIFAEGAWRLLAADGALIAEADAVCLAAGMGVASLAPAVALTPVRGQVTIVETGVAVRAALFGGYAIPTRSGIMFGATHDRERTDLAPTAEDDTRNRAGLRMALPALASALEATPAVGWTGIRATTRDYLPLAGRVPQAAAGLFVLSGLGSRGFCLAPLLGEHLAAEVLGAPSPLPRRLAALIDPLRFQRRARRRGLDE